MVDKPASQTVATQSGAPTMHLKAYSPFRIFFDDTVYSVTAVNRTGPFDILPHHHNFIALLEPCELVIRTLKEREVRIRISGGLLHVKADYTTIFLDV